MAFWGKTFSFDGIPCETYDLMIYDIEGNTQSDSAFAGTVTLVEEPMPYLWKPILLGTKLEKKLTFDLVFGATPDRIDNQQYLDRYDLNSIATWLTGHSDYKWLMIQQDDLSYVRYRCMVTDLTPISYGMIPVALKATITCDGAFAYAPEEHYSRAAGSSDALQINNYSSLHGYYKPTIVFTPTSATNLRITNLDDDGRTFTIDNIPASSGAVTIDCETCVISAESGDNLYVDCNYLFPRLVEGMNRLVITGNGSIDIICSYPINAGG